MLKVKSNLIEIKLEQRFLFSSLAIEVLINVRRTNSLSELVPQRVPSTGFKQDEWQAHKIGGFRLECCSCGGKSAW